MYVHGTMQSNEALAEIVKYYFNVILDNQINDQVHLSIDLSGDIEVGPPKPEEECD